MSKSFSILFFSIFILSTLRAQLPDYHVQVFNERHGLHTFLMQNVLRDQNDFIWILSKDRVQRFDGKQSSIFKIDEELFSMYCDDKNRIWTTSRKNIFRFENDEKGFVKVALDAPANSIISSPLQATGQPVMLLASTGFYFFDSLENKFTKTRTGILSINKTFDVEACAVYKNSIFALVNDTLYRFNLSRNTIESMAPVTPHVRKFYPLNENKILVSYWNYNSYWFDFADGSVTKIDIGKKLQKNSSYFFRIESVSQLNNQEYIISSLQGLYQYNIVTDQFKPVTLFKDGLPITTAKLFDDLFVGLNKRVLGISQYGLFYFIPEQTHIGLIHNDDKDNKILANNIRGFAEDEKGNLWMATSGGFAYFNLGNASITNFKPNINDSTTFNFPSVRGIVYDGQYVILGPTDKGIWMYDVRNKTFRRPVYFPGLPGRIVRQKIEKDFIDHIFTLKNGDHIVSARDGFYLLDGKNYRLTSIHFPGENENGNFSFEDSNRNIWLGTGQGLHCLDSNLNYLFKVPLKMGNNRVMCMLEMRPGEYLVGTDGVYQLDIRDSQKSKVTLLDPMLDKITTNFMYIDKTNKLWVGATEGLVRYDFATKKTVSYNFFDNLQGNAYNSRSVHLTKKGLLFIGGLNGINYLRPELMQPRDEALKTKIMKIIVNNNDTNYINKDDYNLRYFQNSIEIQFTAPYFNNPSRVKYRYQLKGLDKTWVDNGNSNTIRFTSLSPGNYEFKVAATIDNENWFESKDRFTFKIHPPFWKRTWFILLVIVVMGASIYSLYKYQLNKRLEMERLRSHISRDLHDDIGSTLSSINILSKSNLIPHRENGDNKIILQKIQQRSQKMLDAMDDLIWNTKPENDSLDSLLVRMREYAGETLEGSGISFTLNSPPAINHIKLDMQQKRNLFLIFKEAVNNLAKYSNSKNANIQFDYQKKQLQMIITDEGTGFSVSAVKRGNGLGNMQTRAAELNAHLEIRSGTGLGTTIIVQLPV